MLGKLFSNQNKESVLESIYRIVKCPLCCETVYPPVFQCTNGHFICSFCSVRISNCFSCKAPMPKYPIRCIAAENLIAGVDCRKESLQFRSRGTEAPENKTNRKSVIDDVVKSFIQPYEGLVFVGKFDLISSKTSGVDLGWSLNSYQGSQIIYTKNGTKWIRKSCNVNSPDLENTFEFSQEFHYYDEQLRVTVFVEMEGKRLIHKIKHNFAGAIIVEEFKEDEMTSTYTIPLLQHSTTRKYKKVSGGRFR